MISMKYFMQYFAISEKGSICIVQLKYLVYKAFAELKDRSKNKIFTLSFRWKYQSPKMAKALIRIDKFNRRQIFFVTETLRNSETEEETLQWQ